MRFSADFVLMKRDSSFIEVVKELSVYVIGVEKSFFSHPDFT